MNGLKKHMKQNIYIKKINTILIEEKNCLIKIEIIVYYNNFFNFLKALEIEFAFNNFLFKYTDFLFFKTFISLLVSHQKYAF